MTLEEREKFDRDGKKYADQIHDKKARARFLAIRNNRQRFKYTDGVGPSTFYTPDIHDEVLMHYANGLTKKQVANNLGLNIRSLQRWEHEYPEFKEVIAQGKELAECWWQDRVDEAALNPEFSTSQFYIIESTLKRRFAQAEDGIVNIKLSGKDVIAKMEAIFDALSSEQITPNQANVLMSLVKTQFEIQDAPKILERFDELRAQMKQGK